MADAFRFEIKIDHSQTIPALGALKDHTEKVTGKMSVAFNSVASKVTAATFAINQVSQAIQLIGNALSYPLQQFKEFETAMTNVASLGVENIDSLKTAVLDMGETVPLSFKDMADGLYQVVSAGVDAENQIKVLEASAKAGVAGLSSTTEALNLASAVIKGYGKDWSDTESVLDMAFQTVKLGQTTFDELAGSMGKVIPLASTLNVSTEELFGAFATLTGVTGNAAEVATQLRGILAATAKPTKDLTALMKSLGYESATAAIEQEGLAGFLKIVADATGGNADQMAKLFGRIEAVNAVLALSGSQYDTYLKKTDAMRQSTGAMDEAFQTNAETIENHWQILENKFNKALINTIDRLTPLINSLLDFGSALLDIDFDLFIAGLSAAGAALAAFGIAKMVTEVSSLGPALATATKAVWAFATETASAMATATGGITLLTGAIAGLITYLVLTGDNEDELAEKRAENAKKTIELIEAEKKRTQSLIDTQGATDYLIEKMDRLNQKLIQQKKIIADADMTKYKNQMLEAIDELESAVSGWYDSSKLTSHLFRNLQKEYGDDYVKIQEHVTNRVTELIDQLNLYRIGELNLSEQQVERMEEVKAAYLELNTYLEKITSAQEKYNNAKELSIQLSQNETGSETTNKTVNETENKVTFKADYSQVYEILDDFETEETAIQIPVEVPEESLEEYIARVQENFDFENELLKLKFENGLISEEQYNAEREKLLNHELAIYKKYLGAESKEYLKLHKEKIKREREQTKIKLQEEKARQMAAYNAMMAGLSTFENVMGIIAKENKTAFEIYKGIQVTKTIISTIKGAQDAYTWGMEHGGPVVAGIAVAAALTSGMARVAQIESQKPPAYAEGGLVDLSGRVVQKGNFGDGENRLIIANDGEFIVNRESTIKNLSILKLINENPDFSLTLPTLQEENAEKFNVIFPNIPAESKGENFMLNIPTMAEGGEVSDLSTANNSTIVVTQENEPDLTGIVERLEAIEEAIKDLELTAEFSDTDMAITVKNGNKKLEKVTI